MIAFKDLFTIQYACHNNIDFKKKIAILWEFLKYLLKKETDKIFKRQNLYRIIIYKMKLVKDQNIYIVIVISWSKCTLWKWICAAIHVGFTIMWLSIETSDKLVNILRLQKNAWLNAYYIHKLLFQVINQRICWRLKR